MLRDFGLVTVVDLLVALAGVMLVLPAAVVWAEEGFRLPWRARPAPLAPANPRRERLGVNGAGRDGGAGRPASARADASTR